MTRTNAEALSSRYAWALGDALATVEQLDANDMRRQSPENQCSVAALAAHIASVHETVAGWVQTLVAGEALPPITMSDIDRNNADGAAGNADLGKDEVIARLRASGATMTAVLRTLDDEDLARSGSFTLVGGEIDVQSLVEAAVIAHTDEHLASLRAAVASEGVTTSAVR